MVSQDSSRKTDPGTCLHCSRCANADLLDSFSRRPKHLRIKAAREFEGTQKATTTPASLSALFAASNLLPLYREVGQLKATFSPPLAKPEATANCKSGVELTIPVDEGYIYKWTKAEWTGNQALTAQELDALLGMRAGPAC